MFSFIFFCFVRRPQLLTIVILSLAARLLFSHADFGPAPDTVNVGSKVLAKSEEHQVGDDDDGNDIFEAVVQSMDNGQIKVKYTDDGVLETLPAENVKVHLAKFLPTTRRTLVPVPVEGPVPISGPTQPSDDETNEDEQWVEETVDQCSEFVDSTAAAEGVDPPSEESRKQIKDMIRSAVKLRAKGRTFVPMGEVLADPKIRWMWRYYDVVLKNGNLGASVYSRCMVSLFFAHCTVILVFDLFFYSTSPAFFVSAHIRDSSE